MRLSEAMRIGAQRRPRTEDGFFLTDSAGMVCSCALGAAYEGLTGQVSSGTYEVNETLCQQFPLYVFVTHPVVGDSLLLKDAITSLNDSYHWTREQIADWLASLGY